MSNGNGLAAPSCPISNPQQKFLSQRQPVALDITNVPIARDLPSVITAINMMSSIIQHITRGTPQINNTYGTNIIFKSSPPDREPPPQYQPVRWKQITRDYSEDEVVNPDDDKQRISIKTIKRIIWQEDSTEQRVVYKGRQ
jgi:hypothetical protein